MSRWRPIITIFAAGGAVLAPLCAFGHGVEFLTARFELPDNQCVRIEMTADYAGNPLIDSREAAEAALNQSLEVRRGQEWVPLAAMAKPSLLRHGNWEQVAPPSLPPPAPDATHELVTATWEWHHPEETVTFRVPKGRLHDVLLWTRPEPGNDAQWMLLLAGDVSKPIALRSAPFLGPTWGFSLGLLVLAGTWAWRFKWRKPSSKHPL